jgi:hypothetical protein
LDRTGPAKYNEPPNLLLFLHRRRDTSSDLPAGTGWVHPRRAAGRADTDTAGRRVRWARVDGFFFKTVPYPSHIRARRGYTGTTGTGTGVLGHTGRRVGSAGQTL